MTIQSSHSEQHADAFRAMSAQAIEAVRTAAVDQGSITRAQAECLFTMDRTGQIGGDTWTQAAVRAVRDHLTGDRKGDTSVSETDVDWLLGMVGDMPTAFGRAVVFAVVRACDAAPPRLTELAMRAAVGRCLLI
jgi:hypothetical protein